MADYIIPDAVLNDVKTMHAVKVTASTLMRFNYSDPTDLLMQALCRAYEAGRKAGPEVIKEVVESEAVELPKGGYRRAKPKMEGEKNAD